MNFAPLSIASYVPLLTKVFRLTLCIVSLNPMHAAFLCHTFVFLTLFLCFHIFVHKIISVNESVCVSEGDNSRFCVGLVF